MEINKIDSNSFGRVYVKSSGMTKLQRLRADWLMDKISCIVDVPEGIDLLISKSNNGKNRVSVQFLDKFDLIRWKRNKKPVSVTTSFEKMDYLRTRNPFIDRVKGALNKIMDSNCYVDDSGRFDVNIGKIVEKESPTILRYGLLEDVNKRFQFGLPIKIKK